MSNYEWPGAVTLPQKEAVKPKVALVQQTEPSIEKKESMENESSSHSVALTTDKDDGSVVSRKSEVRIVSFVFLAIFSDSLLLFFC